MENVKDGFYKITGENGIHFCSVKGDKVLKIWGKEGLRSISTTWHSGFRFEKQANELIEEIEHMDFIQAMHECATEWDEYLQGDE